MDHITIYPENEKQKSLLDETKIPLAIGEPEEKGLSEKEFIAKIDKSIKQAESGKTKKLAWETQK